jgi:pyruvate/2-oxoglutarate/acetoin dehydrogenase E1 component
MKAAALEDTRYIAAPNYFDEMCRTMTWLGTHPKAVFIGQGVGVAGTTMTDTLKGVPKEKLLEFPVAEELQMGTAIGMALEGWLPICIFPRWNFVLRAADQLVNHLDRLPLYSDYKFIPKVIIRVAAPVTSPFNAGPQHTDDFSEAFRWMLKTVPIKTLNSSTSILKEYQEAMLGSYSRIMVEYTALYNQIPSGVKS